MEYTVAQCDEILEKLRAASSGLASQEISRAAVNGVEYERTDLEKLSSAINHWKVERSDALKREGDYSNTSFRLIG